VDRVEARRGGRPPHRVVARERQPGYDAGAGDAAPGADPGCVDAVAAGLEVAVDQLADLDLDPLSEGEVRGQLRRVQTAIERLTAFRARAAGALEKRALKQAGPGREQQALQQSRRRLGDDLRLPPGEAKRAGETGRRIAERPAADAAMRAGDLPATHARLLAETLRWLPFELRDEAEAELLEAAQHQDARTFGRTCRRLHARVDTASAQKAQDRRNARRSLRMTDTPDGMLALHANGSGLGAETVYTAIQAFRRPDAPEQHRTAEQRSWDALVEVCRAALDAGTAGTRGGVVPHVLVLVDEPTVRSQQGVAETTWMGPMPWPEVRRLLADCGVARVVLDGDRQPTEVGATVRSVPRGLRKALQVRDGVCIGDGCDVPAMWCQIMHLDVPYRLDGRLSLDNAAPGCTYHHGRLDRGGWTVTWVDGKPILHHPDNPPRAPDP
jgi:hypothetical protein